MSNDTSSAGAGAAGLVPGAAPAPESARRTSVPWSPWLGILFALILYFVSQIASGLLLSVYPALRHWSHARTLSWIDNSAWAQFAFVALAEAITVGSIYLFLKRYKSGFAAIGLKRPRWSDLMYGLLALPAYFVLYGLSIAVVSHFVPGLNVNQQQQIGFDNLQGTVPMVLAFMSLVVLPPLAEEIMVRGFIYSTLKKAMPMVSAVIVTSALFAAAHLPEGGSSGPLYIAALDTFILSLVLIYLREQTGSLWASITLHAAKNGVAFVALFVLHAR